VTACGGSSESAPPLPSPAPTDTTDPGTGNAPPPATPPATPPGTPEWTPPTLPTNSPGCGSPQPDASGTTITNPSGRQMHVWGPSGYDKAKTYPVIFMFHGIESNGPDFQSWFNQENYVNNEAFVVYLDAKGGYWDVDGDTDLTYFDESVKKLGETYCIDPSHVYGFGFSWGAFFANHLGCKRAGYARAIMAGEGGYGGPVTACGRLPVLIVNRTADVPSAGDPNAEPVSHGKNAESDWIKLDACSDATSMDTQMNCTTHTTCKNPGGTVTFCEDTSTLSDIPGYDPSWDHTVTEPYRAYAWSWMKTQ
jgi:polyhydroxybutyrate depolymerase